MQQINKTLKDNNFQFKKHFGQNFLTDTNLLKAIVKDANITSEDQVLEIGAGAGTLTRQLASVAEKIVSYEIDKKLEPVLKQTLQDHSNVELIFQDILKQDAQKVKKHFTKPFKVVANLPYYITTPIIFKFLEEDFDLKSLTVMVQKEVAERLTAKQNTKNYGTITVSANLKANVNITRVVNRRMFNPAPNVDSAIITLDIQKNKYNIQNEQLLKQVVKASFSMRRKTLSNNLKKAFNLDAQTLNQVFTECGFNDNIRGEVLSTEQFVQLSNKLNSFIK